MILAAIRDGDRTGLDGITESRIGDIDGDKMPEILDAWGKPIEFLRWAPGFRAYPGPDEQWGEKDKDDNNNGFVDDSSEAGWPGSDDVPSPSNLQTGNAFDAPDFFDPLRVDYRWLDADPRNDPFVLYPLIFSPGRDSQYDIVTDRLQNTLHYVTTLPYPNDPYFELSPNTFLGTPTDAKSDGLGHGDNITNHLLN
jgi:hypothetical protein